MYKNSLSLILRNNTYDTKTLVAGAYQHARHRLGNRTMVEQRTIVTQRSVHTRSQHLTWLFSCAAVRACDASLAAT